MTRVLLVDDHPMVLDGLRALLSSEPSVEIAGEALTGMDAIGKVGDLKPDLVILDVVLPDISGMEVTRRITAKRRTRVLAMSGYDTLQMVHEMFEAGAHGFVIKTAGRAELLKAIGAVMAGVKYVPDEIAARLGREQLDGREHARQTDRLAEREREVLVHLANGLTTQEIAGRLVISVSAVKTYRERLAEKLGTGNTVMLVKIAAREGLVGLNGEEEKKGKDATTPQVRRRTTNDERRTTNDERRTTNDERRTTNDERRTTNDCPTDRFLRNSGSGLAPVAALLRCRLAGASICVAVRNEKRGRAWPCLSGCRV